MKPHGVIITVFTSYLYCPCFHKIIMLCKNGFIFILLNMINEDFHHIIFLPNSSKSNNFSFTSVLDDSNQYIEIYCKLRNEFFCTLYWWFNKHHTHAFKQVLLNTSNIICFDHLVISFVFVDDDGSLAPVCAKIKKTLHLFFCHGKIDLLYSFC